MIKVKNLVVGKRYWFDEGKDISGIFRGRFNPEPGLDYNKFDSIIKTEAYEKGYYIEIDGVVEFAYIEHHTFPECKYEYRQLELAF